MSTHRQDRMLLWSRSLLCYLLLAVLSILLLSPRSAEAGRLVVSDAAGPSFVDFDPERTGTRHGSNFRREIGGRNDINASATRESLAALLVFLLNDLNNEEVDSVIEEIRARIYVSQLRKLSTGLSVNYYFLLFWDRMEVEEAIVLFQTMDK
ncbi:unnamed protein product [Protopolystoma xenopodis]|uniref:Uncharacterized protein n=1 Tax=Protopolystoma xenopodis TaxID=117903 RepID=A0A3S5ACH5_9PLAT|nr:unnamed protein product [Protopolystoma xenopodis]